MHGALFHPSLVLRLMLLLVLAAQGCSDDSTPATHVAPQPTSNLATGERVKVLEEVGGFAKIANEAGEERYVALSLLKHRNTAEAGADDSFTHTVVRDAPSYSAQPATEPPVLEPRGIKEIAAEQMTLNGLFIGEHSGKEVIAPRNVPRFVVDEATGERCWHAYECTHPDCPGERTGGRAHSIFIQPQSDWKEAIQCPACAKVRDLAAETPEQWQQWGQFVRLHELAETLRRRAELDQERRRAREKAQQTGRTAY